MIQLTQSKLEHLHVNYNITFVRITYTDDGIQLFYPITRKLPIFRIPLFRAQISGGKGLLSFDQLNMPSYVSAEIETFFLIHHPLSYNFELTSASTQVHSCAGKSRNRRRRNQQNQIRLEVEGCDGIRINVRRELRESDFHFQNIFSSLSPSNYLTFIITTLIWVWLCVIDCWVRLGLNRLVFRYEQKRELGSQQIHVETCAYVLQAHIPEVRGNNGAWYIISPANLQQRKGISYGVVKSMNKIFNVQFLRRQSRTAFPGHVPVGRFESVPGAPTYFRSHFHFGSPANSLISRSNVNDSMNVTRDRNAR